MAGRDYFHNLYHFILVQFLIHQKELDSWGLLPLQSLRYLYSLKLTRQSVTGLNFHNHNKNCSNTYSEVSILAKPYHETQGLKLEPQN